MRILVHWIILTISVIFAAYVLDGIVIRDWLAAFLGAAVLGVLNVSLRPLLIILTLPVNILTLGLLTFVINAFMLKIAAYIIPGLDVRGFWTAFFGALIVSFTSWLLNSLAKPSRRQ